MNKYIINGSVEEIDRLLIPESIYDITINRDSKAIEKFVFLNTSLCIKFVGFYTQLKNTNRLASERKCNCFYHVPWLTRFAYENNINKTILLYDQQLEEYRYMIRYSYPTAQQSYMSYLTGIIFGILLDMKRFKYNEDNNLDTSAIFHKYSLYFKNLFQFKIWIYNTQNLLFNSRSK